MIRLSVLGPALLASALAAPAAAHPGHGTTDGLLHYLAEPTHVAFSALLLVAGVIALRLGRALRAPAEPTDARRAGARRPSPDAAQGRRRGRGSRALRTPAS
jgi:hypothetical protein